MSMTSKPNKKGNVVGSETMRGKIKRVIKETKKDPYYKDIDVELEGVGEASGPYFGPRNDIERRKLLNEIESPGKDDSRGPD